MTEPKNNENQKKKLLAIAIAAALLLAVLGIVFLPRLFAKDRPIDASLPTEEPLCSAPPVPEKTDAPGPENIETPEPTPEVRPNTPAGVMPIPSPELAPEISVFPFPISTPEPTPEPTGDLPVLVPGGTFSVYGMVAVSDKLTYGVSTVGLLSYVGRTNGRADCYDWTNVGYVVTRDGFTAALTTNGHVLVAGSYSLSGATQSWSGIFAIAATNNAIFGLRADGTVLSTNGSTGSLRGIRHIDASSGYFVAVDSAGSIHTVGSAPDTSALAGRNLIRISAGPSHIVGVTAEGELVSTRANDPLAGRMGCFLAFAGDNCTAIIDGYDRLYSDCRFLTAAGLPTETAQNGAKLARIDNAAYFAGCGDHCAVMKTGRQVSAYGDDGFMQCSVGSWRLRPYQSGGYIFGIAPGTRTGSGAVIHTGDSCNLPTGQSGTAVILGDIDMDGQVTQSDIALLRNYLAGKANLSSAQKQAANIIRDSGRPDAVDKADLEQLRYHLLGYTVIDQYLRSFTYRENVASAERTNTDTSGYIAISGTNINAPIMYGDEFYYHYHSPSGASSSNGSIYLYYDHPSQNTVITGHNLRRSGTMLHDLHKIQDRYARNYGTFKNRVWQINLFGETGLYEVFAMYEEKPNDPNRSSLYYNCNYAYTMERMSTQQIADWIQYQVSRTELNYTVQVGTNDRFVTVVTCSDTHAESELGGRIYFFLRRVNGH